MTILDMCVIQSQERVVYLTWCGQIPIWTLNSRKGFRGSASNWQNTRTTASSGISCARRTPERSLSLGVTLSLERKKRHSRNKTRQQCSGMAEGAVGRSEATVVGSEENNFSERLARN